MSHRRKKKDQLKALRSEPVVCRHCGSTDIIYGKKRGLCKVCRNTVRKPKGGWFDAEGNKITICVLQCNKCKAKDGSKRLFSRKRSGNAALPDVCPKCGGTDVELVEKW